MRENKNMNLYRLALTVGSTLLLISILLLSGCDSQATTATGTGATPPTAGEQQALTTVSSTNADNLFDFSLSDRDSDASYDAATATTINFNETSVDITAGSDAAATASAEGSAVTISAAGTYIISGSSNNGSITVNLPGSEDKAQLVLAGVSLTNKTGAALLIEQADKVFLTLDEGSSNTLSDGSGRTDTSLQDATSELEAGDHEHNATLFSHDDLTINGAGKLVVESASVHGIFCKDDLVIASGTLSVSAAGDGIKGKDSVKIAGGEISVDAGDDGIVSTQDGQPYELGFVSVDGGEINVLAGDDGIHAETIVRLAGGSVNVLQSYEGVEGAQIWLLDGEHSVKSSDDGINAAGSARSDYLLSIEGGSLFVDSEGDGLDSNMAITQSGGSVVVAGPTRSGNGALDAERTATTSGGTLLAVDSSGLGMTYGSASSQPALLYTPTQMVVAGSQVSLVNDASGAALFEYDAVKQFSSLAFSSPELVVGEAYHFVIDGQTATSFTLGYQVTQIAGDGSTSEYSGQGMMGGRGMGAGGGAPGGARNGAAPSDGTVPGNGAAPGGGGKPGRS